MSATTRAVGAAAGVVAVGMVVVMLAAGCDRLPADEPAPTVAAGTPSPTVEPEPEPEPAAEEPPAPQVLAPGESYVDPTGAVVTVVNPTAATGVNGDDLLLVDVVIDNRGTDPIDPTFVRVEATAADGTQGEAVLEPGDLGAGITNTVVPGTTAQGTYAFALPAPDTGGTVVVLTPGDGLGVWQW